MSALSMRLATRMGRLGTETAFEVMVRAKALEAQGRTAAAARAQADFRRAWSAADVTRRLEEM